MPAFDTEFVRTPVKTTIIFGLEPVQNTLNSLTLINQSEKLSGLNQWITHMIETLSPKQLHHNRIVLEGLHYAIIPTRRWSSFPAYLDDLAAQEPKILRDRIFSAYDSLCCRPIQVSDDPNMPANSIEAMESLDYFLTFLRAGFPPDHVDIQVETEAYRLLKNPPAMKALILDHLREMWTDFMAVEWERNLPMLQACVEAFRQLDFTEMLPYQVAKEITGQDVSEKWPALLREEYDQFIFVPSAHLGPYLGKFRSDRIFWLLFGARLPEGTQISSPALSRSEILVRLSALADDTRLQILQLLQEYGELCSKEIIERLDLSQSAASRHLTQLSATGYLIERRMNSGKCYSLNEDKVTGSLQAMSSFLLG